jgi:alkylhydroperoxidase family enzyme
MGEEVVAAVFEDYRTAPVDERTRAALAFVEKLTLTPGEIGPGDAEAARRAGVGDQALREAVQVCALFSAIDRVADALRFTEQTDAGYEEGGWLLLKAGYRW